MSQSVYWRFTGTKNVEDENTENCTGEASIEQQVGDMEGEVKEIQMELAAMKQNRQDLANQNKAEREELCLKSNSPIFRSPIKSLKEVEFCMKVPQMSKLREELKRARNTADEERFQKEKYERRLKDLELKINCICNTGMVEVKEPLKTNDEVSNLRKQLRDAREELEEVKTIANEKTDELQEYRLKYLQARQEVEELKRQIDAIEFDNKQVSDQIQLEIQKIKMQFQEKLQELAPLPDLLKASKIQLQEATQLKKLAEESSEQLSGELTRVKEKLVEAVNNLHKAKSEKMKLIQEKVDYKTDLEARERELEELYRNADDYKCHVMRLEERLAQLDLRYSEKAAEYAKLAKELDELREESTRSTTRIKERAESMRRCMQTQVTDLERQLVEARAQCRTFQKERDDVRQRMQLQVNNIQENFNLVELRLRTLQNEVSSLKNCYANILTDDDEDVLQKSAQIKECTNDTFN